MLVSSPNQILQYDFDEAILESNVNSKDASNTLQVASVSLTRSRSCSRFSATLLEYHAAQRASNDE